MGGGEHDPDNARNLILFGGGGVMMTTPLREKGTTTRVRVVNKLYRSRVEPSLAQPPVRSCRRSSVEPDNPRHVNTVIIVYI